MSKHNETSENHEQGNSSLGVVSNCANHQIRRCMHCNYKWAYNLYFAAQSNAAKCPNCNGLMSTIIDKF